MSDPMLGLIGVAAHYFKNFIEMILPETNDKFHVIIGIIRNRPELTAGHCYIFSGPAGSGKTSLMTILRKVFEGSPDVEFADDIDPNKVQVDPLKTYFIATNLPPDRIRLRDSTIFKTAKAPFPKRIYDIYMRDFELFNDSYKMICDRAYQEWNRAYDLRNNL